jgi:hypothetical protein
MSIEDIFGMPDENLLEKELAKYRRDDSEGAGTGQVGGVSIFKLTNGITTMRVLPPVKGAPSWHREIYQHWNVKTANWDKGLPLTCPDVPRSGVKTCPICAKYRELLETKDAECVKFAQTIRRQMKVMLNVMIFGAPTGVEYEDGKVYLLMSPKSVVSALLGYDKDEQSDYPDITGVRSAMIGDGLKGYLFKIIRSGVGINTTYEVQPRPHRVDLIDQLANMKPAKTIADLELYDIMRLFPAKDISELQAIADQIQMAPSTGGHSSLLDDLKVKAEEEEGESVVTSPAFMDEIRPPEV